MGWEGYLGQVWRATSQEVGQDKLSFVCHLV
jgi:hypothetical protein